MTDGRRRIPSVDSLLGSAGVDALVRQAGRTRVVNALRAVQAEVRATDEGSERPTDPEWYAAAVARRLAEADQPSLRRVVNATGVVLHTNLGRAPLAAEAQRALAEMVGYGTLEFNLDTGERGSRHDHCVGLLRELTGADAALVVNNNAAAVVLALNTLASDGEVVISRGELVEIGGSFRVPEIMERSGARMREVGATNRTHLRDYQEVLGPATRLVLKVHRSNFRVEGFTAEVGVEDLASLARGVGVPLVHDLGSGALLDLAELGIAGEPTIAGALAAGADVVTLSGDKLLGGPQAGIILGRADLVERMRRNPLCRAFRCDKLILAALEATLTLYRDPDRAMEAIPVLRMLAMPAEVLAARAAALARALVAGGVVATTEPDTSPVGGGACPGVELPTTVVAVDPGSRSAASVARALRRAPPRVICRIRTDQVLLDPRTIDPSEEESVVAAVLVALASQEASAGPARRGDTRD